MVTKAWRMLRLAGHDVLFCLLCDTFTFDPQDIAETYCEHCDRYLRNIPQYYARTNDDHIPSHDPIGVTLGYQR